MLAKFLDQGTNTVQKMRISLKKNFKNGRKKISLKKVVSFEKLVAKSGLGFLIQSKLSKPLLLEAGDSELGVPF